MVSYLGIFGRPVSLSETIANGCLLLMASVIGSYVFGAVWADRNVMAMRHRRRGDDEPGGPAMPEPGDDREDQQ